MPEFFETRFEHTPGQPTFVTRGQRDRWMKRNKMVCYGKSDVAWMKRQAEKTGGRLPPKHDLKKWWRSEAPKYRDLLNKPALVSR